MKKFKLCTCVTAARLTVRPFDIEIFDTDVLQYFAARFDAESLLQTAVTSPKMFTLDDDIGKQSNSMKFLVLACAMFGSIQLSYNFGNFVRSLIRTYAFADVYHARQRTTPVE